MNKKELKQKSSSVNIHDALFNPGSIVVIGASNNDLKPGGRVIKNIKSHGFEGKLWAVNPKTRNILDLPTFSSIEDLPGAPDLAIIAIPAKFVLQCLKDLARKKVRVVIILTSGFGEKDDQGKILEREMLAIAEAADITLIGPNCSGFMTPAYKGKFAGIIPELPGNTVDFISGSGATVDYVMEQASYRGLSFGTVVNLGNSIQMGVEDILGLYDEQYNRSEVPVLMLYMEIVKKPLKLMLHARSLSRKGCFIVGIKSGTTAAGKRAAASHTGAMATNDTAVDALFAKSGIIRVRSKSDMIDVACVLSAAKGPLNGKRICVVTDAGGPGVMMSDELNRQGMELPVLKDKTQVCLREILPPESATANPVDCLPSRTADQIRSIVDLLAEEEKENVDAIAVVTGNSLLSDNWMIYKEIREAMDKSLLPVIPVLSSAVTAQNLIARYCSKGHIYFTDEVHLAKALRMVAGHYLPDDIAPRPDGYDKRTIADTLSKEPSIMSPRGVEQVLRGAGFRLPDQISVLERKELTDACNQIGFPMVMKVIGPLHKSDVGGVTVGLEDLAAVNVCWDRMMTIKGSKGVLLQSMVSGTELILGTSREEGFGHLVMFGIGGIYTEVLKDVQFALAPLSLDEGLKMIRNIHASPILEGARGNEGVDIHVLGDYLVRLGCLVTDFPEIDEIDLNPVKGFGSDLFVVDARIIKNS